jgi:hypothetical protein
MSPRAQRTFKWDHKVKCDRMETPVWLIEKPINLNFQFYFIPGLKE